MVTWKLNQSSRPSKPVSLKLIKYTPKDSFRVVPALKQVQVERPAYQSGAQEWWSEVIRRTALGAGADSAC